MRFLVSVTMAAALCAPAFSAGLTDGERGRALGELHASRKLFLDAIEGLTEAQWKFRPAGGGWSIAECAEHVALSEDLLFEMVTRQIMGGPAEPERKAGAKAKDAQVLKVIADRSQKAKAPQNLEPKQTWPSRNDLAAHFKQSRERLLDYVRTSQDDLRSHFRNHPALGPLDGYQWILLISTHTLRHVEQINEVKTGAGYPK